MNDGHTCLSSREVGRKSVGDFNLVLSFNILSQTEGEFVIHVWSNSYDYSPHIQRLELLEKIGFTRFASCSFTGNECYYQVLGKVKRLMVGGEENEMAAYHQRFNQFADKLQEIFDSMRKLDKMLSEAGIKLPYSDMSLRQTDVVENNDVIIINKGEQYNVYKKVNLLVKQAKREVFIVDVYPDESLFELYLDDIPNNVSIKFLTNKPKGKFNSVAALWKSNLKKNIEIKLSDKIHDRLLFVDDECWIIGSSFKDAGKKKPTYIIKFNDKDLMYSIYIDLFNEGNLLI